MKEAQKHIAFNDGRIRILLVGSVLAAGAVMATRWFYPPKQPDTFLLPINKFPVTSADLAFGQKQVDQMMRDRPAMAQLVKKGDVIYNWTVRQFAGESLGHRILWYPAFSSRAPSFFSAYSMGPGASPYGSISIRDKYADGPRKGMLRDGEELWSSIVFESFNLSNWRAFSSTQLSAFSGEISRDDFIKQYAQLEFLAIKRTSQFYQEIWQPWAAKSGLPTKPHLWHMSAPNSYEEWIKQFTDPSGYPYNYGKAYDFCRKDHIIFTMYVAPNYAQIYMMTPDGRGNALTDQSCYNGYARTSPDRKKIVFISNRSGEANLYIMNANASNVAKLPAVGAALPAFSPDGKTIVYISKQSGIYEIYSTNSDGTNQVRLTHHKNTNEVENASLYPAVSPDGQKIAFTSVGKIESGKLKKTHTVSDIYLMNRDGTNLTRLTKNLTRVYQPCFSPDGQKIAFVSYRNGNADLYTMSIDGTGIVRLTSNAAQDEQPCFSPDGKSLAFVSNRLDGKKYQLFKLDIATKKATLLFKTKYHALYPNWK